MKLIEEFEDDVKDEVSLIQMMIPSVNPGRRRKRMMILGTNQSMKDHV